MKRGKRKAEEERREERARRKEKKEKKKKKKEKQEKKSKVSWVKIERMCDQTVMHVWGQEIRKIDGGAMCPDDRHQQ